ncbi:hypothetical protein [Blastococcus sp. TF02A-35]|uniref:hypothetical protein n=1 Tax=Blastococcus sp. TF02A-35 TaxID=2559612 RepID=UPI0010749EBB|nr:hypothetical protein [Blastococcus sp. TF02A_35]TFV52065.1 hypothetical protein E4P43_07410 [Blastococcus sp. TF02A_35]
MSGAIIPGVLLEGLNYAGKTSAAHGLAAECARRNVAHRMSRCFVTPSIHTEALHQAAFASLSPDIPDRFPDPDFVYAFNALRSAEMISDAAETRRLGIPEGYIHIQDRNWLTQFCHNEFFTPRENFLSRGWREHGATRFAVQVFLTCGPVERARRAQARSGGETHQLNRYFRANLDAFPAMEALALGEVGQDPDWEIIETDELSTEQIVQHVLERLENRLPLQTTSSSATAVEGMA